MCFLAHVEMEFQIQAAPRNYHESLDYELLPFLGVGVVNVIGLEVYLYYPMRDYGYLAEWPLAECNHPSEWVQTKPVDMANFQGQGSSCSQV